MIVAVSRYTCDRKRASTADRLMVAACDKIENTGKLAELWILIAEGELLNPGDYTPESWAPFTAALDKAKTVAESASPALKAIDEALQSLRETMHALVKSTEVAKSEPALAFFS